jgi:hypothetical protein
MLQSDPFTMVYHEMVTVEARGGYGLLAERVVRPTYYVYQLYQRFGSELVAGTSDVEYVSIYAARREDGALTLLVVNWNEDARSVPLQVENFEASGEAEVWLLDAEHNAENLGMQPLTDSLDLPPYSATLYVIPGE